LLRILTQSVQFPKILDGAQKFPNKFKSLPRVQQRHRQMTDRRLMP